MVLGSLPLQQEKDILVARARYAVLKAEVLEEGLLRTKVQLGELLSGV